MHKRGDACALTLVVWFGDVATVQTHSYQYIVNYKLQEHKLVIGGDIAF